MTEKITDAVRELAHRAAHSAVHWDREDGWLPNDGDTDVPEACADAVLDALAAAAWLTPVDNDPRHIIEFRPDGWTIKHPLACRPDLFACRVNLAAEDLDGPPVPPGRYEVAGVSDIDGRLLIGDRVDQAEG